MKLNKLASGLCKQCKWVYKHDYELLFLPKHSTIRCPENQFFKATMTKRVVYKNGFVSMSVLITNFERTSGTKFSQPNNNTKPQQQNNHNCSWVETK